MDTQETSAREAPDQETQGSAGAESATARPEADAVHDECNATAHDLEAVTASAETAADTPAELRVADAAEGTELTPEQLLITDVQQPLNDTGEARKLAILEAIVYVTDEPLSVQQIASALDEALETVRNLLDKLVEEYNRPEHGLTVKEIAGGYKMATKPEHHEAVRSFVKKLNPPLKLSLAALETLAVIAYKQPITAPEIMEIRGVQGAGVLKTLLDRKLITTSGRKQVVGKPILYKTTKDFLVQFGLKDLAELPTLKEFEDLRRMAFSEEELPLDEEGAPAHPGPAIEESVEPTAAAEVDATPEDAQPAEQPEPGEHAIAHEGGGGED